MISKWNNSEYGRQDDNDMWGLIQTHVRDGWFVPSKDMWAIVGGELNITEANFASFNLSGQYWSSSLYSSVYAWIMSFGEEVLGQVRLDSTSCVRLITTF